MDKINSTLIVAGTHGNELSGIYLHKLIKDRLYSAERSTFATSSVIANPEAVQQNVRYLETDLNREFAELGNEKERVLHESKVAAAFAAKYAANNNQLIVDLHNTTSTMGANCIFYSSDAADEQRGDVLGGSRNIHKNKSKRTQIRRDYE